MKPSSSSAKDVPFAGGNSDDVQIEPGSRYQAGPGSDRRSFRREQSMQVKTYVILRRIFRRRDDDRPNLEILDVKLTLAAAEAIRDAYAGTWIERVVADKQHSVSEREQPGVQRVAS